MLVIENPMLCGLGEGEKCCAFLVMGHDFECGREDAGIAANVRARLAAGTMNAKYDPGFTPYPQCQEQRTQDPDEPTNVFIDDAGRIIENVHDASMCAGEYCVIHNPSDHHMRSFHLHWREAGPFDIKPSHFERICPHGIGHPDPDSAAYWLSRGEDIDVHGCDGCCQDPGDMVESLNVVTQEPLPAERRVHLYLSIARKMRAYPEARGVRHAAVKQAWAARKEINGLPDNL